MNKDINFTLAALVPLLQMNHEKVVSIEAVKDWFTGTDGRTYCKEVAEITYENGHRRYADIGSDSNLTACYDVLAVIQQIKRGSEAIEGIARDVYEKPNNIKMTVAAVYSEKYDDGVKPFRYDSKEREDKT